jgi:hypothetical protein
MQVEQRTLNFSKYYGTGFVGLIPHWNVLNPGGQDRIPSGGGVQWGLVPNHNPHSSLLTHITSSLRGSAVL